MYDKREERNDPTVFRKMRTVKRETDQYKRREREEEEAYQARRGK
jgi:hypothetical protein